MTLIIVIYYHIPRLGYKMFQMLIHLTTFEAVNSSLRITKIEYFKYWIYSSAYRLYSIFKKLTNAITG